MKLNEKKINEFFKIINEKKIKSVFQPIVSLKTEEIVSFEALSRITLESCTLNIEELFKIAHTIEQSWKLDQLCRKCAIKASQQMPSGKKLFINVDANILLDSDFVQGFTKEYLKKYHLDSNNIVFELSETTSIGDKHLFKQAVRHYRSQGFEIAIDDVGSGYSNLNRINHTQPEYIKPDKELIQDIHLNKDKHTMVEVMVNYCKAMHYKLIVEGIEYGQGYYLKKPVDNFDDLLPDIKETIKKLYNKYKKTLDIPTIDFLCHFPCTLKTYQNINNAYQIFEENNTTQRIYVINDERHYLGYLKRENMLCNLDAAESNLFKDSLIVPSHLPIKNVCQLFLENEHSHFYEDIIVLKNQCFYGIVTIKDLLKYLIK